MRATITVTGPTLHALAGALDIASGSIVTEVREGEGWEDDGAVTYSITVEGEGDDPHPADCAACAAGEPSVHAYEAPAE